MYTHVHTLPLSHTSTYPSPPLPHTYCFSGYSRQDINITMREGGRRMMSFTVLLIESRIHAIGVPIQFVTCVVGAPVPLNHPHTNTRTKLNKKDKVNKTNKKANTHYQFSIKTQVSNPRNGRGRRLVELTNGC